jgi:hypothetical protein
VGKERLKERYGLESQTNFFTFKKSPKTECGLDSRIYGTILVYLTSHFVGAVKILWIIGNREFTQCQGTARCMFNWSVVIKTWHMHKHNTH